MDPARDPGRGARPALSSAAAPPLRVRARRWLRPPRRLRPTRAGWCFFAVVFGVGFAALNTGNNLLYLVLSLMLSFLALSGFLSEAALRGIEVRRRLPHELFADVDNPVRLEVRNRQRRVTSLAVVIEDRVVARPATSPGEEPALRGAGRCFVMRIPPGGCEVRRYALRPARRGPLELADFEVSTRFPFGLFLKSMTLPAPESALVYPKLESLRVPPRAGHDADGEIDRVDPGEGTSVSGVREFCHGDSLRRVHWKTSLRRGQLLVRELEDERQAEIEVLLRTQGSARDEDFEQRVSWAASEIVAHLDAGLRVSLRTDSERLEPDSGPRQRARLLGFLARVQPDAAQRPASRATARPARARAAGRRGPA